MHYLPARVCLCLVLLSCFLHEIFARSIRYHDNENRAVVLNTASISVSSSGNHANLPSVLVAAVVKDGSSFSPKHNLDTFLDMISSFDYPNHKVSIALLVSDKSYFNSIESTLQHAITRRGFKKATVLYKDLRTSLSYGSRHADEAQRERRRTLARLRNWLLYSSLRNEGAVLWIDADVINIPPGLLKKCATSGKDIIAVRNMVGDIEHDKNTWKGTRIKPTAQEREAIAKGGTFVPRPDKVQYLDSFAKQGIEWVEIDSVGATFLYVNSLVHREGVAFTTSYVIGSEWEHEGYDGIESEGLCYTAKHLGYKCWGLASEFTTHAEWWQK